LVREVRTQVVELRIRDGSMTFEAGSGLSRFVASRIEFQGNGTGSLQQVNGPLVVLGKRQELNNAMLSFDGAFRLVAARRESTDALAGRLEMTEGSMKLVQLASAEEQPAQVSMPPSIRLARAQEPMPHARLAWALLALIPLGLALIAHRERHLGLSDAEAALIRDRPRRAVRITRRILRRTPLDADALFLHGAGLFQAGDTRAIVREVDRSASKVPVQRRFGLALLLSLAHAAEKNHKRAERWAAEASRHPQYRDYVARGKLDLAGLRSRPATDDSPPAGYA
jgi:hypothetical protein